jgi:hypothetical protein
VVVAISLIVMIQHFQRLQAQPLANGFLIHRVDILFFAAVDHHGEARIAHILIYMLLRLPQKRPADFRGIVALIEHGKLHKEKRQGRIQKQVAPKRDQRHHQRALEMRMPVIRFALIIQETRDRIRSDSLDHGFGQAAMALRHLGGGHGQGPSSRMKSSQITVGSFAFISFAPRLHA